MNVDAVVVLATVAVIFPAELPDKSMFAAIVLASRFKALPVWIGLAAAFAVHVAIAVAAGGLIAQLPERPVAAVVTLFFLAAAAFLLLGKDKADRISDGDTTTPKRASNLKAAGTAFGLVFASEWGDLTQLATINLTARYDDPTSVAIGALCALWCVTGIGVLFGKRLVKWLPLTVVRRIAGVVMLVLGIWSFVDFLNAGA